MQYSARFRLPDTPAYERTSTLRCPVFFEGTLVVPVEGVFSLEDTTGATYESGAVSVDADMATYTLTNLQAPIGEGYRTVWRLTLDDGGTYVFQNEAAVVKNPLHPVLTDADIFQRLSALNPSNDASITSKTDYQDYREESWVEINQRIINKGKRPWLILSPSSLRACHLYLTLALIFEDLGAYREDLSMQKAQEYRSHYERAFQELTFVYDNGRGNSRTAGVPSPWLLGRGW